MGDDVTGKIRQCTQEQIWSALPLPEWKAVIERQFEIGPKRSIEEFFHAGPKRNIDEHLRAIDISASNSAVNNGARLPTAPKLSDLSVTKTVTLAPKEKGRSARP